MKRCRQEEFPPEDNHEEDCAGNWREHPQLRTRTLLYPSIFRLASMSPIRGDVKKQFFPFSSRGGRCCWEQQYPDPLDGSGVSQPADIALWRTSFLQSTCSRSLRPALRDLAGTKHPAFYSRVLRAFKKLGGDLSSDLIDEATAAPPDYLLALEA